MPQLKNKTKPAPKKSNELKECQEAIEYLLEELEQVKETLSKISGRMGL
jgi:DNA-directed RNA polymerase specialized sigma54-like protein